MLQHQEGGSREDKCKQMKSFKRRFGIAWDGEGGRTRVSREGQDTKLKGPEFWSCRACTKRIAIRRVWWVISPVYYSEGWNGTFILLKAPSELKQTPCTLFKGNSHFFHSPRDLALQSFSIEVIGTDAGLIHSDGERLLWPASLSKTSCICSPFLSPPSSNLDTYCVGLLKCYLNRESWRERITTESKRNHQTKAAT